MTTKKHHTTKQNFLKKLTTPKNMAILGGVAIMVFGYIMNYFKLIDDDIAIDKRGFQIKSNLIVAAGLIIAIGPYLMRVWATRKKE